MFTISQQDPIKELNFTSIAHKFTTTTSTQQKVKCNYHYKVTVHYIIVHGDTERTKHFLVCTVQQLELNTCTYATQKLYVVDV